MSYIKGLLNPFIAKQSREKLLYINNHIEHSYDFSIIIRAGLNLVNLSYENERQLVKLINMEIWEQYIPKDLSHHFRLISSTVLFSQTPKVFQKLWVDLIASLIPKITLKKDVVIYSSDESVIRII